MAEHEIVSAEPPSGLDNCFGAQNAEVVRLQAVRPSVEGQSNDTLVQLLAPVDGGRAAWMLLFTAFIFEALLWGETPHRRELTQRKVLMATLYRLSPVLWCLPGLLLEVA